MPGPDLHLHSTASDGVFAPRELVVLAARAGIPTIAITDHDTVDGVAEAIEAASGTGVGVVPAVELSAGFGDRSMHILGYHVDHTDPQLLGRLATLRQVRVERAERIVYALAHDGFTITLDDVLAIADGGAVGRTHIAQMLVESGQSPSVRDAFTYLLGSSAPYFVPKPVSPPARVISWIRDSGGVAVLAHPGLSMVDDLIHELVDDGIIGLEVYHGSHDRATRERYAHLANSLGLIATGGSDFHGVDTEGEPIGSVDVPESAVSALAAVHGLAGGR